MTNLELVQFVKKKLGTAYVYGTKGTKLTLEQYNTLKKQYPSYVWYSDQSKVGQVCCDCSGLIGWATGKFRSSQGYRDMAKTVNPISTIGKAPVGALVWKSGHIGVYVGGGKYIACDGSAYGCRESSVAKATFTHWFLCCDIKYIEEDDAVVEESKMIIDGKEVAVRRILKDGTNYIAIRDVADTLGYEVGNEGSIALLDKK